MKKLQLIFLLVFCLPIFNLRAENLDFTAKNYEYQGFTLPYREAAINADNDSTAMLVILLHSRHSCGRNNDAHRTADGVNEISHFLTESGERAIFLVPQIPDGREWNEKVAYQGFFMTDLLKSLIDQYVSDGTVNPSRIYILGASMGGSGVWRFINDYPDMLAGALTAASNPRDIKGKSLLHTPICSVVGDQDRMVKQSKVERVINEINRCGGKGKFVLLKGARHGDACRNAFRVENLQWVFSNSK